MLKWTSVEKYKSEQVVNPWLENIRDCPKWMSAELTSLIIRLAKTKY